MYDTFIIGFLSTSTVRLWSVLSEILCLTMISIFLTKYYYFPSQVDFWIVNTCIYVDYRLEVLCAFF